MIDDLVFVAVLAAAVMHAGWNALVKLSLDRFSAILLLAIAQSVAALLLLPLFAVPAAAAWPWLAASCGLHTGYKLFLIRAYAHGDLAQVYPLARGTAPPLVALFGALFLGELLGAGKLAAILAIATGVILMSLRGGEGLARIPGKALGYALGTACFTAAYTLVDAVGARLSGTASGFALWMFVFDGAAMLAVGLRCVARAPSRLWSPPGARASPPGCCRSAPTGSRSGPLRRRRSPWSRRCGRPASCSRC